MRPSHLYGWQDKTPFSSRCLEGGYCILLTLNAYVLNRTHPSVGPIFRVSIVVLALNAYSITIPDEAKKAEKKKRGEKEKHNNND